MIFKRLAGIPSVALLVRPMVHAHGKVVDKNEIRYSKVECTVRFSIDLKSTNYTGRSSKDLRGTLL